MSDLEEQAASWVPPWQRPPAPTPQPTSGMPADVSADTSTAAEPSADTSARVETSAGIPAQAETSAGIPAQAETSAGISAQAEGSAGISADDEASDADSADADVSARTSVGAGAPDDIPGDGGASADLSASIEAFGGASADGSVPTDTSDDISAVTDESLKPESGTRAKSMVDLLAAAVPGQRAPRSRPARQVPAQPGHEQPGHEQPGHERPGHEQPDPAGPAQAGRVEAAAEFAEPLPALSEAELVPAIEAILMVVDEPLSEITLAQVLDVPAEQVANALIDLSMAYTRQGRGFDLRRAAGGWRYYTRAEYSPYVERFVLDGQQLRLTQASLETLAVIAYKQPVTRSRISAIRGVNCDGVIRTLVARGMIEECGTEPESGAHLYRTTTLFLEKVGLDSVDQLPPLAPFLPDNLEEIANGE